MHTPDFTPTPLDALELDSGIFRAYDIRGITTTNLTDQICYWIGRAFAAQAISQSQHTAAVGRDGRLSSPGIERALSQGLVDGIHVVFGADGHAQAMRQAVASDAATDHPL